MNGAALAMRQVVYENRSFWRNPAAAFFTVIFPLIFLVLFNVIFGDEEITVSGHQTTFSTFYVPAIGALSVITACYTNIAMMVCLARDRGQLKRVRGTPLPAWAYLFGRIGHAVLLAALLIAIVTVAGVLFYDVDPPGKTFLAFAVTLAVGAASFCALGLAVSALIPNAEAAPAIVNATILPLFFISDVFIRVDNLPAWLDAVANVFPVRHFSEAMQTAFNPWAPGLGFEWLDLAVIGVWGLAGALVALRYFTWEPRQ